MFHYISKKNFNLFRSNDFQNFILISSFSPKLSDNEANVTTTQPFYYAHFQHINFVSTSNLGYSQASISNLFFSILIIIRGKAKKCFLCVSHRTDNIRIKPSTLRVLSSSSEMIHKSLAKFYQILVRIADENKNNLNTPAPPPQRPRPVNYNGKSTSW